MIISTHTKYLDEGKAHAFWLKHFGDWVQNSEDGCSSRVHVFRYRNAVPWDELLEKLSSLFYSFTGRGLEGPTDMFDFLTTRFFGESEFHIDSKFTTIRK